MPHQDDHVTRVKRLALYIAEREGGDADVLRVAADLHDICRNEPDHAKRGAERAREILKSRGYNNDFIEKVCHCIESHSFSGNVTPETLEAKILSDADRLDAIGAIGVARAFMFSGKNSRDVKSTLMHFEEKLLRLRDLMHTKTGREIAERRHRFMEEFYRRLKDEMELKDVFKESRIG